MSSGHLILHPTDPLAAPTIDDLAQRILELGLAGQPLPGESGGYTSGERFLQLITFLGCSPFVQMEPQGAGDLDYCHLRLLPPTDRPRLIVGSNTRPPRCPHCGKGIGDWLSRFTIDPSANHWDCPACGQKFPTSELKWRRQGGLSRLFLVIPGIFPSEAVPLPELLNGLSGDGKEWSYFYAQGPLMIDDQGTRPLFNH